MSAGWEVGDLALCVDADFTPPTFPMPTPANGEVRCVVAVGRGSDGVLEIDLEGYPDQGFEAQNFRKIKPDAHEGCEPEFVTLLKRSKQGVRA